jgi:hypothetical protein
VDFPYALNREGIDAQPAPGSAQQAALAALLATLLPENLTVPQHLQLLMSAGFGGNNDRQNDIEIFPTAGGPVFDPYKATEIGAVQTLNNLLNPERLNRLEFQSASDPSVPSPARVSELLVDQVLSRADSDVGRRIATTAILALARAQRAPTLSPTIALALSARLDRLGEQLRRGKVRRADDDWARGLGTLLGDREALDKAIADPARLPRVPPGMPIG